MSTIPLSLYIHIPWCERKCPYCDFNSHQQRDALNEAEYVSTLLADLDADLSHFGSTLQQRAIQTIFIGGGTPSLFSADSYARLFHGIQRRLEFADDIEITLEANPGSSEAGKFQGFRQAGINRLSIGVQSFNPSHLTALGRIHSSNEAVLAAQAAQQAGFSNFNLDLMFGLSEQTEAQALADLKQAIALSPTHLSCYQLTIEPNTLFYHAPPVTPDDEALWSMQDSLQTELAANRYQHYEVSAYSQSDKRCRHNLNYWQYGDYLGIGAGAHAKVTLGDTVQRAWKIKHPATYITAENKLGDKAWSLVEPNNRPFEFMMNALRLLEGFSKSQFETRCQLPLTHIDALLEKHAKLGLIEISAEHVKPTLFGHNMLNTMLEDYLEST